MHWVYVVRKDLTYKFWLVHSRSCVKPKWLNIGATIAKTISVVLSDLVVDVWNKEVLTGDICNIFIQSIAKEKI